MSIIYPHSVKLVYFLLVAVVALLSYSCRNYDIKPEEETVAVVTESDGYDPELPAEKTYNGSFSIDDEYWPVRLTIERNDQGEPTAARYKNVQYGASLRMTVLSTTPNSLTLKSEGINPPLILNLMTDDRGATYNGQASQGSRILQVSLY